MSEAILTISGVTKNFSDGERELRILRGVNLTVNADETVAIIGRSGTGKSTLLALLGLLDRPTGGSIKLKNYETTELGEHQRTTLRGKAIGFIFQQHHLLADFTALENVCLAGNFARQNAGKKRAMELLSQVGLAERMHHRPARMSGGEQQRVAIARALYTEPALLLCDEPTGNLDPATGVAVMDLVWQLAGEKRTAMILVTHDLQVAARAPRTLTLQDGQLAG
ncbi:lipoprotein-releasing system ATP-binding protein LolD [Planctomycetales bacterium]|nr:lipoprotein-releasing system ATP-binding protein LolD [Planctomycetales bacterium]GHS99275.1 lipoprotein-releasing system ATP-binding protein LolD [Planctomycetales bacterium]GHT04864.1 lipoprotein-releasing system ATP-binding protein LolD [Planctomycetales bacterium]